MKKIAMVAAASTAAASALWLRKELRAWGTERGDLTRRLPGDDLVTDVSLQVTQAVNIDAPPTDVWPWLVQIGQDRGGFYSYDWLENLIGCDIHSADHIVEEWQEIHTGDSVRLAPRRGDGLDARFEVLMTDPPHSLVLVTPGTPSGNREDGFPYGTWSFRLVATAAGGTHLIARSRYQAWPTPMGRLMDAAMEIAQCVMQRKMLLGIRDRAENEARHPMIAQHPHLVVDGREIPKA